MCSNAPSEKNLNPKGYNERLFRKKGIRSRLHHARFHWLKEILKRIKFTPQTVLELGCHDAKTIDYLPNIIRRYDGYDADWENGLSLARNNYTAEKYSFFKCDSPEQFNPKKEKFDLVLCMETAEHLPQKHLDSFLKLLSTSTLKYTLVTVPNEKGPLFLLKYLYKKWFIGHSPEHYSLKELFYVTLGKLSKIPRSDTGHKGFDYSGLAIQLEKHFEIKSIEGIPFRFLPKWMNFSIAFVLKPKASD